MKLIIEEVSWNLATLLQPPSWPKHGSKCLKGKKVEITPQIQPVKKKQKKTGENSNA